MVNKIKSCVFISGAGSNLLSIIKSSREYNFPIKIDLIITDNVNAKGILIAKKYNIPLKVIPYISKDKFERKSLFEIKKKNIKFLCLAGFMKVLSANFIKKFKYQIINIHPSLLPSFKGLNTHRRVLKSRAKYSGCTVHFVSSVLDSGKIILQKRVLISRDETEKTLKKKILAQEHKIYPRSIISIFR
jgi:formyltetrahydrofolate-dependent phosphoribosylglycinamide formyltransferase